MSTTKIKVSNISSVIGTGSVVLSASPTLTGTPLTPTAAIGTNTTQIASTAYVRSAIADLVASAPSTLDTLNELAAALGNDVNFSTTVTNSLALKAPLASPTFTGTTTTSNLSYTGTLTGGTGVLAIGTNQIYKDASGNVGIGTSIVTGKLAVLTSGTNFTVPSQGNIGGAATVRVNFLGPEPGLMLNTDVNLSSGVQSGTGTASMGMQLGIYNVNDVRAQTFWSAIPLTWTYASTPSGTLTERMRIDTAGNVGIGTTPSAKLDVAGGNIKTDASSRQIGYWEADAVHDGYFIPYNSSGQSEIVNSYTSGGLLFKTGTSKTTALTIDASQNVGIGTAPSAKLDVKGTIRTTNSGNSALYTELSYDGVYASGVQDMYLQCPAGRSIRAYVGGSEKMVIDSSGIYTNGKFNNNGMRTVSRQLTNSSPNQVNFSMYRVFYDAVNWGHSGILLEFFSTGYYASITDYGMYYTRWGYSSDFADVLAKIPGQYVPYWGSVVVASGNLHYRDLFMPAPAYRVMDVRITIASSVPLTLDGTSAQNGVVYLY